MMLASIQRSLPPALPRVQCFNIQGKMPSEYFGEIVRSVSFTWEESLKVFGISDATRVDVYKVAQVLQNINLSETEVLDFSYNELKQDNFRDFLQGLLAFKHSLKQLLMRKLDI